MNKKEELLKKIERKMIDFFENVIIYKNYNNDIIGLEIKKLTKNTLTITVKTRRPGLFIGCKGTTIIELSDFLKKELHFKKIKFNIIEDMLWSGSYFEMRYLY